MLKFRQSLSRVCSLMIHNRQLLHTSTVQRSRQIQEVCKVRAGLILGVYTSDDDPAGSGFQLTPSGSRFDQSCDYQVTRMLSIIKPIPKLGEYKVFYGIDSRYIGIAIVGLGDECSGYNPVEQVDEKKESIRIAAGVGVKALRSLAVPRICVDSMGHSESAAEGACMASWLYQDLKSVKNRQFIKKLDLFDSCDHLGWKIGMYKAAAQNLTRLLQETPGNNLTPCIFAQSAIEMLAKYDISVNVRMRNWAQLRNMNGFLSVARGSCEPPVLLEILYEGCDPDVTPIVMIGKGVTYNAGGLCERECSEQQDARGDLMGAAAVIATFRAIASLRLPVNVLGLVPLCANVPGASAYKPGDIITTYNRKSILVEDTGCEGLLLHADALSFAQEYNPKFILDIGTLSQDMIGALGEAATAVFSNSESLFEMMRIASIHTGDRVWRLPLWRYYEEYMKSATSDFNNKATRFVGGGACKAAAFLREFVPPGIDWIHIDTYNVIHTDGKDIKYLIKGMSGRPTRTLIEFLAQLACKEEPHKKVCAKRC